MAQTQICKFYMDKGCNNGNCKFFHDPDLCVTYWTEGQCLIPDCRYNHKYINQICKYNKYILFILESLISPWSICQKHL